VAPHNIDGRASAFEWRISVRRPSFLCIEESGDILMSDEDRTELRAEAALFEATLAHGTFDPNRIPSLPTETFDLAEPIFAAAGPDASYQVLSEAIAAASATLDIYIYNLTGEAIANLVAARIEDGVAVRILYDVNDLKTPEKEQMNALRAAGAEVRKAPSTGPSSVFTVCHQKLCIADRRLTCLGSGNWGGSAFPNPVPAKFTRSNREWVAAIDDEPLAAWWTQLFEADWSLADEFQPQDFILELDEEVETVFRPVGTNEPPGPFSAFRGTADPARATPVPSPDSYLRHILPLIEGAKQRIFVEQQYIPPSDSADELLSRIKARAEAGVDVRLIVSPQFRKVGKKDNWELTQEALRAHDLEPCLRAMNIKVFSHLHNKGLVVDDKVVVSSTNWSENSLIRAREAGLIIEHRDLADYFAEIFEADWAIAWPSANVKPNMAALFLDAAITPGGLKLLSEADFL
jgi:cardiolipin synthase